MKEDPTTHPDFGELEAYRHGEADAATVHHLAGCAECQLNLKELDDLAAVVRGSESPLPSVPDEIEKRILWNARQNAARVRRQRARPSLQRWAIAASLLLSVATVAVWRQMNRRAAPQTTPRATLDIVDALALARQLGAAQPGDRRYDVNHDGRVDDADVVRIVRQAVALGDA
jgi:anti-sigma-K factor RskA